jgi:ATP-binding cassette subfamily B protein
VVAAATLAIPAAFKQMIDLGFGGAAGSKSIQHVDLVFLALFGVATILALATAARFYMVSWLGERVTADIRSAVPPRRHAKPGILRNHADRRSAVAHHHRHHADQAVVGTSISMALRNVLLFLGGLVMLFVTSAKLSASSSAC